MLSADDLTDVERASVLTRISTERVPGRGCRQWLGGGEKEGRYGRVTYGRRPNRRTTTAHRVVYVLTHPDEPPLRDDEVVRHSCDWPPCCEPTHLLRGVQGENLRDMLDRERGPSMATYRENQRKAAATRGARWDAEEAPRIIEAVKAMEPPRTVHRCEMTIPGYSYARRRMGGHFAILDRAGVR